MCHYNFYVQEVKSGRTPTDVEVYMQGHRGYALIFDIVCLQASYGQEMVQRHGQEYDWRSQPIDPQAAYASAGG
jgi:hypothetical protein